MAMSAKAQKAWRTPAPNATLSESRDPGLEFRDQAAAPPVYTIILPLIPLSLALYITSTRYSDFRHHGFDLLGGALIGTVVAWLSFRLYHLPVRRGAGWAWGSRSATRAFGARIGTLDYVESNEQRAAPGGIEAGNGHAMSGPAMSAAGH